MNVNIRLHAQLLPWYGLRFALITGSLNIRKFYFLPSTAHIHNVITAKCLPKTVPLYICKMYTYWVKHFNGLCSINTDCRIIIVISHRTRTTGEWFVQYTCTIVWVFEGISVIQFYLNCLSICRFLLITSFYFLCKSI